MVTFPSKLNMASVDPIQALISPSRLNYALIKLMGSNRWRSEISFSSTHCKILYIIPRFDAFQKYSRRTHVMTPQENIPQTMRKCISHLVVIAIEQGREEINLADKDIRQEPKDLGRIKRNVHISVLCDGVISILFSSRTCVTFQYNFPSFSFFTVRELNLMHFGMQFLPLFIA